MKFALTEQDAKMMRDMGLRVRRLRRERGMSITELADASRVSRFNLYHVERGSSNCGVVIAARLATGLGVGMELLFDGETSEFECARKSTRRKKSPGVVARRAARESESGNRINALLALAENISRGRARL